MEKQYKISCATSICLWQESTVKSFFGIDEINNNSIEEVNKRGVLITELSPKEVEDFRKANDEARRKHEQSANCSDCGSKGVKSEMEYGDKGYVCTTCWENRAKRMMR